MSLQVGIVGLMGHRGVALRRIGARASLCLKERAGLDCVYITEVVLRLKEAAREEAVVQVPAPT